MKIALVTIRFDQKGGSERRTYQLAKGLLAAGHEVEVFAAEVSDMDLNAPVSVVPVSAGPSFVKVASFTKKAGEMLSARSDIDVVHNQIRPFTDGIVTVGGGCHAEYLERTDKPMRLLNPLHRVILNLERERYKRGGCSAVITNSRLAKDGLLRHYDYPEELVFVAYNGVDAGKFNPTKAAAARAGLRAKLGLGDGPVALFLGAGFERKGLKTAIKALGKLKGKKPGDAGGWKLLVAGGDDPGPYQKVARKLGVADRVFFAGAVVSPQDYYGASDIFVLPTLYDPFSNAALEAMACGLPVITTYQNGVREIIRDGENGFLMENPEDHSQLAEIMAALSDRETAARVGEEAVITAGRMTWDDTTRKTIQVYKTVA